jgi:hypothetical protein
MSALWSGGPAGVKLSELDVICAVLGCGIDELLLPEPGTVAAPAGLVQRRHHHSPSDRPPFQTQRRRSGTMTEIWTPGLPIGFAIALAADLKSVEGS